MTKGNTAIKDAVTPVAGSDTSAFEVPAALADLDAQLAGTGLTKESRAGQEALVGADEVRAAMAAFEALPENVRRALTSGPASRPTTLRKALAETRERDPQRLEMLSEARLRGDPDAAYSSIVAPEDRRNYIDMYDPPVLFALPGETEKQWTHMAISPIHVTAKDDALDRGFTIVPVARVLPPPTLRCTVRSSVLSGMGDPDCPYVCYRDEELETHMKIRHKDELAARTARLERDQREETLRQQRLQTAILRKQAEAAGINVDELE